MNKQHYMAGLGVALALLVAGVFAYREGYFWKKPEDLALPAKDCFLHKTPMKTEVAKASSGTGRLTITWASHYGEARKTLFPCVNDVDWGGHAPNVEWYKRQYCEQCRNVRDSWRAKNLAEQAAASDR